MDPAGNSVPGELFCYLVGSPTRATRLDYPSPVDPRGGRGLGSLTGGPSAGNFSQSVTPPAGALGDSFSIQTDRLGGLQHLGHPGGKGPPRVETLDPDHRGGHLGPRGASPSSGGGDEPGGSPPRGGPGKNLGRSSRGFPLGAPNQRKTDPPVRSVWKGLTRVTPGVVPLGRGFTWGDQLDREVMIRGRNWSPQKTRTYYLSAPLGCFVRTTPAGRPVRDKWTRRKRK